MAKIKLLKAALLLDVERATTEKERERMLDAADLLLTQGRLSNDRKRFKGKERPQSKRYRPFRNRAIIYALFESGMRRTGVTNIYIDDIDFHKNKIITIEKGGNQQRIDVSQEGMEAIQDYIDHERDIDNEYWQSPYLFLPVSSRTNSNGKLTEQVINTIWDEVAEKANVIGKTPHSARHAMGNHILKTTGSQAAVQDQLKHRNPMYSNCYTRITNEKKQEALNSR